MNLMNGGVVVLLSAAAAAASPLAAQAAACLAEGQTATIGGYVMLTTVPPTTDPPHDGYVYPRLRLDRPLCLASSYDTDRAVTVIALVPSSQKSGLAYRTGEHVVRSGKMYFTSTADQPPDKVMMMLNGD